MYPILWFRRNRDNDSYLHALILGAVFGCCSSSHLALASDSDAKQAGVQIAQILEREAAGESVDRDAALSTVFADDASNEAKTFGWQSGKVIVRKNWVPVANLSSEYLHSSTKKYLEKRQSVSLDASGHRVMAKWCADQGLLDQARAHWNGVVGELPDDIEARQALGHEKIADQWFAREELQAAKDQAVRNLKSAKVWMPKIRQWVTTLGGTNGDKKVQALNEIRKIDDPNAVFALRTAAVQVAPQTSVHFVKAICRFRTKEACMALTSIAILDPSSPSGLQAIEGLVEYPLAFFVPDILQCMSTATKSNAKLVHHANGDLVLEVVQLKEMAKEVRTEKLEKLLAIDNFAGVAGSSPLSTIFHIDRESPGANVFDLTVISNTSVASEVSSSETNRAISDIQNEVAKQAAAVKSQQKRLADVLRSTTGAKLGDDAKEWWSWWESTTEIPRSRSYKVQTAYDRSSPLYEANPYRRSYIPALLGYDPSIPPPESVPASVTLRGTPTSFGPISQSCLGAGTLIQTESGLMPVEQIRIGDLIISKDVATGEVGLKPVLQTTRRPPAPTRDLVVGEQKIRATLGHYWWVSGDGWIQTGFLKPGMLLHTARGNVPVTEVVEASSAETFNLVVADWHTYFVGSERILSYDVTELTPTLQVVPGLSAATIVAK